MATNIILNPTSLWAKVVIAKYYFPGTWTGYTKSKNYSTIQREITSTNSIVQCQFHRVIGNGHSINLFNDPWTSLLPFSNQPTFITVIEDVNSVVVSDIITNDKEWDVPLMANSYH